VEGLAAGALRVDQHAVAVEDQVRERGPPAAAAARRAGGCGRALRAGGRDVPAARILELNEHCIVTVAADMCHRHPDADRVTRPVKQLLPYVDAMHLKPSGGVWTAGHVSACVARCDTSQLVVQHERKRTHWRAPENQQPLRLLPVARAAWVSPRLGS